MGTKPMVFPLDKTGTIYALYDEDDKLIGTGSREDCYAMLEFISKMSKPKDMGEFNAEHITEMFKQWADEA